MAITTIPAFNVARERGGWLSLLMGALLFALMTTWRRGAELLAENIAHTTPDLETFMGRLTAARIPRIPGTAVFFTGRLEQAPPSLQQLVQHTRVLYERVILVAVVIEPMPTTGRASAWTSRISAQGFVALCCVMVSCRSQHFF